MFGRLGWAEILVIVVLLVILFGHAKIPNMMKNLANGLNAFKKEMKRDNAKPVAEESAKKSKKPARKRTTKKK